MLDLFQGWDTSVSGTISKGRFAQGAQHPRIFGREHIGRGHINPASGFVGGMGRYSNRKGWPCQRDIKPSRGGVVMLEV
jgi:hypothetical protein